MSEPKEPANDPPTNGTTEASPSKPRTPLSKSGWDGKLRVTKQARLADADEVSDAENSDDDGPPSDEIAADEGKRENQELILPTSH